MSWYEGDMNGILSDNIYVGRNLRKWEPQTGFLGVSCYHSSWRWMSSFASEALKTAALRPLTRLQLCVCECSLETCWPQIAHLFFMCPQTFQRKAFLVQKPEHSGPKLSCGSFLFTVLACDGGATQPLPITDCHFDGDATGRESNSLSSSHWKMFTAWKVTRLHQSTGTHTSMHTCKHTYIKTVLLFSTCWFIAFVLNHCFSH